MAKKQGSTALAKWNEELAKHAAAAREVEKNVGGGNFIGLAGGRMKYKGAEIPGNKMNCIVVDHMLANLFYEGKYDPDNPAPPTCYAFGKDTEGNAVAEEEMAPHEQAAEPQSEGCYDCDQNQWPDAKAKAQGDRAKPCKNSRRLALITEGDMEDLQNAEIAYMHLPVTSVRAWAGYVRQCSDVLNKPPFAVVTQIELVPDSKTQFKVQFELVQTIDDGEAIGALLELHNKISKEIAFPFQAVVKDIAPAPKRGKPAPVKSAPAGKPRVAVGARK